MIFNSNCSSKYLVPNISNILYKNTGVTIVFFRAYQRFSLEIMVTRFIFDRINKSCVFRIQGIHFYGCRPIDGLNYFDLAVILRHEYLTFV